MASRLHGNDGRTAAHLYTVGRQRAPHGGRRRTPHRHSRGGGNPRRGETGMGSRLHGNDGGRRRTPHGRAAAHPHRHSRDGGNPRGEGSLRWVPVSTGTTVGGGAPPHGRTTARAPVIPATAGGGAPTSSFPRRRAAAHPHRHSRDGGNPRVGGSLRWVPVYTGTTVGDGAPRDGRAMARPHRYSRDGGNPRGGGGACDGFPSTRERR